MKTSYFRALILAGVVLWSAQSLADSESSSETEPIGDSAAQLRADASRTKRNFLGLGLNASTLSFDSGAGTATRLPGLPTQFSTAGFEANYVRLFFMDSLVRVRLGLRGSFESAVSGRTGRFASLGLIAGLTYKHAVMDFIYAPFAAGYWNENDSTLKLEPLRVSLVRFAYPILVQASGRRLLATLAFIGANAEQIREGSLPERRSEIRGSGTQLGLLAEF